MSGGGFTKAQRCEYMDLCRQMTSRDPAQMTRANRDRLLAFLKDYVIEHSAEYPEKREFIMETIPLLFDNPTMLEDPNYLGSYNLVAFQCSILFTILSMNMSPDDLEIYKLIAELKQYELDFDIKNISDAIKSKIPLKRKHLLTGLTPAILERLESSIKIYNHNHSDFGDDEEIKANIRRDFDIYPEARTVRDELLEFVRIKCRIFYMYLSRIVSEIRLNYAIGPILLKENIFYFAILNMPNVWTRYKLIRDFIIKKRKMGIFIKTAVEHTEDMNIELTGNTAEDTKQLGSRFYEYILYRLYSTDYKISQPLFIITIISYIYVQEFVDAIVHNVYYCGLAYKLQNADDQNLYPYHFLMHDYLHGSVSLNIFAVKPRIYFEKLFTLIMRTTFQKDIRYSILLILFYLLHEANSRSPIIINDMASLNTSMRAFYEQSADRWYNTDDLGFSIPKAYRGSEESIDTYIVHSFRLFYEYFQAVQDMEEPLPNSAKLSRSAKKLLNLYVDKEVSVNGSPNVNKMKRLLQTRKVAKLAANTARKSKSRSHS
jgi:hypothetical protein